MSNDLFPRTGGDGESPHHRITDNPRRDDALAQLDNVNVAGLDRRLQLEGDTRADCLIECQYAMIWIEGKRNDWLSYSIDWAITRD